MMTHIPVRQRSAREQQEAGVLMPYFLPDTEKAMSGPLNYHLTMVKFPADAWSSPPVSMLPVRSTFGIPTTFGRGSVTPPYPGKR